MSFDAMSWASKKECQNSTNKLVLLMLANYSDENESSYPSYKHLAKICECSERTVMRSIDSLISLGLLKKQVRFNSDGKQTSNRFILCRDDKINTVGVSKSTLNTKRVIQRDYTVEFNQWWDLYPRKDGSKRKAFELWKKITDKEISHQKLFEFTKMFKVSINGTESKFIPHATTWLNQRRFETVEERPNNQKINLNQIAG